MRIRGKVYKCADNIDTDVIIPAKYLNRTDEEYLAQHCLEPLVEQTGQKLTSEHIIVAGKNFGCGSSREHAPVAIKSAGIKCVIAESFARIFFRNAINIGLPLVELKDATKLFNFGDEVEVDFNSGSVRNVSTNNEYRTNPFPEFLQKIISSGGLVKFVQEELRKKYCY
ncbi:MAG: 3-isopropylmalate dehydratase small subunit [Endomicrobia bacterium]|nr:3-isopropylmalate dehydratase small subunit [Endomicrobiia bacterium]